MSVPFVVVHGAVIWKLSLVAVTGAVLALVALVRRRRAHRAVIAKLVALGHRSDPGVVRGTLGGGELATLTAAASDRSGMIVEARPEALWIETTEGRVTLDGVVRVVAGSHATAARLRVPTGTPDELVQRVHKVKKLGIEVATLARVSPGDEVIALGRLETVAGDNETDLRTNASARVLRATDDMPIQLAAQRPRAAAPRMSVLRIATIVALTPLIVWKIEAGIGESWRKDCEDLPDPDGIAPFALSNTDTCALATAMPGSREDALHRILELAERTPYRDRGALERLIELAWLIGSCDTVVRELNEAERYEELLGAARACRLRRAEHIALLELGRFDEAAAVPVPAETGSLGSYAALPTAPTLILAGRWAEAATAADARATEIQNEAHKPDAQAQVDAAALAYRCLGELLRHHGGDSGALARLRELAAGQHGAACAPALAQAAPEAEVARLITPDDAANRDTRVKLRAFATGISDGSEMTTAEAVLAQPDDLDPASEGAWIWLAATAPPLAPDAPALDRARLEHWQAVAAMLGGDLAAARQHAARAVAAASAPTARERFELRDVATLPAVIELYTRGPVTYAIPTGGRLERALWLHDFGRLLLRSGAPLAPGTYFGPDEVYVQALETAARGDGTALAKRMGAHHSVWWTDADFMAVLPRITVGRDAVVRQLVWGVPKDNVRLDQQFPWSVALHAAARRAALHVAGEDTEAARWAAIYQRYDQTLRDRRKLIALALWKP